MLYDFVNLARDSHLQRIGFINEEYSTDGLAHCADHLRCFKLCPVSAPWERSDRHTAPPSPLVRPRGRYDPLFPHKEGVPRAILSQVLILLDNAHLDQQLTNQTGDYSLARAWPSEALALHAVAWIAKELHVEGLAHERLRVGQELLAPFMADAKRGEHVVFTGIEHVTKDRHRHHWSNSTMARSSAIPAFT